ncbi:MAG: phytanoyl-CoA dioxygenase family protein, partial [Acidimicrobiales bacterium]|nr:phytanoyl-CoA dioxygenase family protein [Acidimicrobiales bacterium]
VYDPEALDFRDREGRPLDLTRSFSMAGGEAEADTLADLRHFIHQTGFAHVRGVVGAEDLEQLLAEVDRLQALARPGDDRSWWARRADGTEVVCRLTYVNERSGLLARAHELTPLQELVDAVTPEGAELAVFSDRNDGHSVVIKNHDVVDGLSDLPWHIDCGLGGHPVLCPTVLVGVQLTSASSTAGQLQFLAGSWRTSCHQLTADELTSGRYPVVAVDAEPGDITMHFGHGMHVAPPPTSADSCRRTLYLGWNNVACGDVVPAGSGYNDVVLHSGEDNRVLSVPEQLARG